MISDAYNQVMYYIVTSERLRALRRIAPKYKVRVRVVGKPGDKVETEAGFKGVISNYEAYVEILPFRKGRVNFDEVLGAATDLMESIQS